MAATRAKARALRDFTGTLILRDALTMWLKATKHMHSDHPKQVDFVKWTYPGFWSMTLQATAGI
jgi:hypothetical protein